jgi:ATP-dependent Lon protease
MKLFTRGQPTTLTVPVVPLRDLVVFPGMVVPVFGVKRILVDAIEEALKADRKVFLVCQRTPTLDPKGGDLYTVGTLGTVLQHMKLPDGTLRALVEGEQRGTILSFSQQDPFLKAEIRPLIDKNEVDKVSLSLIRSIQESFKTYAALNKKIPAEITSAVDRTESPHKLVDLVCAHAGFKIDKKIELLGIESTEARLRELASTLELECELLDLQQKITNRVKKRIEKGQREYFLQEQMKEISRELGRDAEDPTGVKELEEKVNRKGLPEEVLAKVQRELRRLEKLQTFSPEAGIIRTYIEWIVDLPWNERTEENRDIEAAEKILNEDHYDLKKPKERILDFIAVHQLKEKVKGPILCFVGPPGTGKTSLGKSVARCLGRNFVRISLGGVKDEAEIRGHRKTYVGALPGKIIQSMRKAGTRNPVFLLDEVDKMSSDFRGDPAAALLEVLDPEQNSTFLDHYLEVPYDLSNVMFITTANSLHNIPYPLRDRMEVIEIPGYTEYEKLKIAEGFIIPKQIEENGLSWADIRFRKDGILHIIQNYTMESGVRNLEREIAQIVRKLAREAVRKGYARQKPPSPQPKERDAASSLPPPSAVREATPIQSPQGETPQTHPLPSESDSEPHKPPFRVVLTAKNVSRYLGNPKHRRDILYKATRPGLAYGLAWTELGGTILPVEAVVFEGKGELLLTGSLGDVMKESALTAFSFLKSTASHFKLSSQFYKDKDVHIHIPEGAIPKDGPSAGITITSALLSAFSGQCVNPGIAMTGEITLTGKLLPIGGVKEKVLAAHRNRIPKVLLPEENRKDIDEIPKEVVSSLEFIFVDTILEALRALFPPELFQEFS